MKLAITLFLAVASAASVNAADTPTAAPAKAASAPVAAASAPQGKEKPRMKTVEEVWGKSKYGNGMPRLGLDK